VKFIKLSIGLLLLFAVVPLAMGQSVKIGIVDLNKALNESEEGIRSKNILESEGRQKQKEFKLAQEDLRKQYQTIQDNLLMTAEAKQKKGAELRQEEQALVQKGRQFEQEIRQRERQFTAEIFKELRAVIRTVAKREKFDFVLERNFVESILYMTNETSDLTQKVIDHYNSLKSQKSE